MTWKSTINTILVGVFLLAACGNDPQPSIPAKQAQPKQKAATEVEKSLKSKAQQSTRVWLSDQNSTPFLTDYFAENPERNFIISTEFGEIEIAISEKTPVHSGNFLYLVKEKQYYNQTQFYRVTPDFLIQGGDADNDMIQSRRFAIGEYSLPAEFGNDLYHKRGAVGMSRNYGDNPDKRSTAFDFYIIIGKKHQEIQLQAIERDNDIQFTAEQREVYKTVGGAPHLDHQHTVFGHIVRGMDVVEKISAQPTDSRDWPKRNIPMKITIEP